MDVAPWPWLKTDACIWVRQLNLPGQGVLEVAFRVKPAAGSSTRTAGPVHRRPTPPRNPRLDPVTHRPGPVSQDFFRARGRIGSDLTKSVEAFRTGLRRQSSCSSAADRRVLPFHQSSHRTEGPGGQRGRLMGPGCGRWRAPSSAPRRPDPEGRLAGPSRALMPL